MYTPTAFLEKDVSVIHAAMRHARLSNLVTATRAGPVVTPLPLLLDGTEGEFGTLYGHLARGNDHWRQDALGNSLAIFMGPEAYVTPSWYATKPETGKVVPTWNYLTVHAHGPVEFFHDADRLLDIVTRLTDRHEISRPEPWHVSDAPDEFIAAQLRGIVGLRMPITSLEGKSKMSQNRTVQDQLGVVAGLEQSDSSSDRQTADLIRRHMRRNT